MMRPLNYDLLEKLLSAERLNTYLRHAEGNKKKAADLYIENLKQCQILYTKLHWLEIGLRNALNRQLSQKYGSEWFNNQQLGLEAKEQAQIQKAKETLQKDRKPLTNANIVAALSFGFWVNLFNVPYENLWRFPLRKAFAGHKGALKRHDLSKTLHPILRLRNRVAHYEPIMKYDLRQIQQDMINIVRWIEPDITELP